MSDQETVYPTWFITTLTGHQVEVQGQLQIEYPMVRIVKHEREVANFGAQQLVERVQFAATLDNVFIERVEEPVTGQ